MSLRSWWRSRKKHRQVKRAARDQVVAAPLREFVYLDAVSLHSLLVSQNATIPSEVSQAISRADEAEMTGTLAGEALVARSEVSTRYQTSNSNTLQTSRKAVIQTLFKEFRDLPLEFKFAALREQPKSLRDVTAFGAASDTSGVVPVASLTRGDLVEIEVSLAVDPVFKLSAMMTEYLAMADESPTIFEGQGTLGVLRESGSIMKAMDRFLAGLIPIKATATNHVVVELEGSEFVVHTSTIGGDEIPTRPLHVVGVTEHLGYWKDIRRVLFSEGHFTVLARVARSGIHETWTPVKLADLFSDVAPDLMEQINAIEAPTADGAALPAADAQQQALALALARYKTALVDRAAAEWSADAEETFGRIVATAQRGSTTASAQRQAFDSVRTLVSERLGVLPMDAGEDLSARQSAREHTGLELFPSLVSTLSPSPAAPLKDPDPAAERLLDVEIIAIYW